MEQKIIDTNSKVKMFSVAHLTFDVALGTVIENHETKPVRNKVMQVLLYLAINNDRVVSRDELINHIWQGNSPIGSKAISDTIWQLRKLLGGSKSIKTHNRQGYQLVCSVSFDVNLPDRNENVSLENIGNSPRYKSWLFFFVIAFFLLSFVYISFKPPSKNIANNVSISAVTNVSGEELWPAISPDQQKIVFTRHTSKIAFDLYIKTIANNNSNMLRLTNTQSKEIGGTWSPDGTQIAFERHYKQRDCTIFIIDVISKKETKLGQCLASFYPSVSWSPNGKYLAYYANKPIEKFEKNDVSIGLYLYNLENKTSQLIVKTPNNYNYDSQVNWSKDSHSIAFIRTKTFDNQDIYIKRIASSTPAIRLTIEQSKINGISWRHSSINTIFYSSTKSGNPRLYKVDIKSKSSTELLPNMNVLNPIYLATTNTLYFLQRTSNKAIQLIDLNSTPVHLPSTPLIQSLHNNKYPHYSSAQNKLLFQSDRTGVAEIWMSDLSGDLPEQLTHFNRPVYFPSWSPDGKKVAFISAANHINQVFIMDIKSKQSYQLTTDNTEHLGISWAIDGKSIYTKSLYNGWEIWSYPLNKASKGVRVLNETVAAKEIEGGVIYFDDIEASLYKKTLPDGKASLLISGLYYEDWANWDISSKGIYYVRRKDENDAIEYFDFKSNSTTHILNIAKDRIYYSASLDYIESKHQLLLVTNSILESDLVKTIISN